MTQHFPIVIERETNGTFSAWVAGLPGVYAAADTAAGAKRGIRGALSAHLDALQRLGCEPGQANVDVVVLRYDARARSRRHRLQFVGLGALMGRLRSRRKTEAARRNGRRGGRPRKAAAHAREPSSSGRALDRRSPQ